MENLVERIFLRDSTILAWVTVGNGDERSDLDVWVQAATPVSSFKKSFMIQTSYLTVSSPRRPYISDTTSITTRNPLSIAAGSLGIGRYLIIQSSLNLDT
jgi:hypothetical protein